MENLWINIGKWLEKSDFFGVGGIFFLKLTFRQEMVLEFIKAFIKYHGFAPCLNEIAQGIGLRSKSNIHRIVHSLQKKKLISMNPLKARSIKVKK